jgi:hypothetical protein
VASTTTIAATTVLRFGSAEVVMVAMSIVG